MRSRPDYHLDVQYLLLANQMTSPNIGAESWTCAGLPMISYQQWTAPSSRSYGLPPHASAGNRLFELPQPVTATGAGGPGRAPSCP